MFTRYNLFDANRQKLVKRCGSLFLIKEKNGFTKSSLLTQVQVNICRTLHPLHDNP